MIIKTLPHTDKKWECMLLSNLKKGLSVCSKKVKSPYSFFCVFFNISQKLLAAKTLKFSDKTSCKCSRIISSQVSLIFWKRYNKAYRLADWKCATGFPTNGNVSFYCLTIGWYTQWLWDVWFPSAFFAPVTNTTSDFVRDTY